MTETTRPREIWTRLTVDPIADPLARRLARVRGVTPNRITWTALLLGLATAACFATGHLRWGGALFLLRFVLDCLDGKVARLQGSASARGAALDVGCDVVCVTLAAVTLADRLVRDGLLRPGLGLALVGVLVVYDWALAYRKGIAAIAGRGTGGAAHAWRTDVPVLRSWVRWCRRMDMSTVPWTLEAEIVTFGLAPLLLPASALPVVVALATAFLLVAVAVNLRRIWRLAQPPEQELPAVDVVIATRDRPALLRRAVDSVLAQTYPGPITVHVVHDRSAPDPTLAREEGDRVVRVLANDRSPGLAGARNAGILDGTGDLVAFCDDDDHWLPDKLRLQVAALRASGDATCVTGIVVEYAGRAVPRVPRPGELGLDHLVRHRVMAAHPSTVLVRRADLLGPIGLVDEAIPGSYGEDFDWIIRAARHGPISVVERPLVRVTWGQSMFSRDWQTIVDAIDYGLGKTPELSADPVALGRLYGRRAFALAALGSDQAPAAVARTLRVAPLEKRAYLAMAVTLRLVSAERLLDLAHRRGRGI